MKKTLKFQVFQTKVGEQLKESWSTDIFILGKWYFGENLDLFNNCELMRSYKSDCQSVQTANSYQKSI